MRELFRTYIVSLYQNIPTEVYEGLLSVCCLGLVLLLVFCGIKKGLRYSLMLLLIEYVFQLFCSTAIFRSVGETRQYNFQPFWSYKAIQEGREDLLAENIMNVVVFVPVGLLNPALWWLAIPGILLGVGAVNIINFTDGINGMIAMEAIASLAPYIVVVRQLQCMDESLLWVAILSVVVFAFFNFRPKGGAKCFAGDVGSISLAFILLFPIGTMIMATMDITYLTFLVVYGVEGCLTIIHRLMLHEKLGEAHRKHAYEIMANELDINPMVISVGYMTLQLIVSFGFILMPNTILAHWTYFLIVFTILCLMYVLFKKKYYHLHEAYLASLK